MIHFSVKNAKAKKSRHRVRFVKSFWQAISQIVAEFQAHGIKRLYWVATDSTAEEFQQEVAWRSSQAAAKAGYREPLKGPVRLEIDLKADNSVDVRLTPLPLERKPKSRLDPDNVAGAIQDGLEATKRGGHVIENDRQVKELIVRRE